MLGELGDYRIVAQLGRGGTAEVHLAIRKGPVGSRFTKLAVVKRLRADLLDAPECAAMLVDEARITARVRHPNVVQTLEVGVDGDEPFLVMEYLDGLPLHLVRRRAAKRGITIPLDVNVVVVHDILAGLHCAHELCDYDGSPLSIVHRDVTPHNVFVTIDGTVKVVDFGVAKAMGRIVETTAGVIKGKVRYMSPEHARAQPVDRRADVFSAGVILWEALTGTRLWEGRDDSEVATHLAARRPLPSARELDETIPEELDRMCRKALAVDKNDRYPTAEAFRSDIEAWLGNRVVQARRQLGPLVSELFADERSNLRAVIEFAMKELDGADAAARTSERIAVDMSPSVGPFVVTPDATALTELADPTEVDPVGAAAFAAQARRPAAWLAAAAATLMAGVLGVGLLTASAAVSGTRASAPRAAAGSGATELVLRSDSVRRAPTASDLKIDAKAPVISWHAPAKLAPTHPSAPAGGHRPGRNPASSNAAPSLHLDTTDPWARPSTK